MKKFKVRIYRDGSWFRKWIEDFEVEADEVYYDRGIVDFSVYNNGNKLGCEGMTTVCQFKADKYSVHEVK